MEIMRNVDLVKELVHAKYGDFKGYISIDNMDHAGVYQMCKDNGIDMEKYFLISFGLSDEAALGIGSHKNVHCMALLLEKDKYGSSFDEIVSNVKDLEAVDVIKEGFFIEYSNLRKYIKRFSFSAVDRICDHIKKINIID
jgi:hypothetical protein